MTQDEIPFAAMEKALGLRSNLLAYHLDALKKSGVVEKRGEKWRLTPSYERLIPLFPTLTDETKLGAVSVVLVLAVKDGRILLTRRAHKPYQEYWSVFGTRLRLTESVEDAAKRCLLSEGGVEAHEVSVCGIVHERLLDATTDACGQACKHAFLFVVTQAEPLAGKSKASTTTKWFSLSRLPKKRMIPSDIPIITKFLGKKTPFLETVMEEKKGRLAWPGSRTRRKGL
jgi:ADP-ribose pyrophosphatase YjhB (NUDIX family)